jgi:uncharacterized protein (TIGR02145 family)
MKTLIAILIGFSPGLPAIAQDIPVTFSATGAATTIDQVTATNLRTNESVALPGNETLILKVSTGVPAIPEPADGISVYPNPFNGRTMLTATFNKPGTVHLCLLSLDGKRMAQLHQDVHPGRQGFELSTGQYGIYLVFFKSDAGTVGHKVISTGAAAAGDKISYSGIIEYNFDNQPEPEIKSALSGYSLGFSIGDIVLYRCVAGIRTTIFTDSPAASKNYTVRFVECTDQDGNNYPAVEIGTQFWMAGNLKTTKYRNASPIPNVTDITAWKNLNSGAYCTYNNTEDPDTINTYGRLYNWFTIKDTRGICPTGWHVPGDEEWTLLAGYLGGDSLAGGKLKETGTRHWTTPNTGATNETGFTALPGGFRSYNGRFESLGFYGYWWSATGSGVDYAWFRSLSYSKGIAIRNWITKEFGYSVRCVMD